MENLGNEGNEGNEGIEMRGSDLYVPAAYVEGMLVHLDESGRRADVVAKAPVDGDVDGDHVLRFADDAAYGYAARYLGRLVDGTWMDGSRHQAVPFPSAMRGAVREALAAAGACGMLLQECPHDMGPHGNALRRRMSELAALGVRFDGAYGCIMAVGMGKDELMRLVADTCAR